MMYAAASGDLHNLRRHMFLGHDLGVGDFDGRTPLHLAAAEGHVECVRFLLHSCGVNAEPTDRYEKGLLLCSLLTISGNDLIIDRQSRSRARASFHFASHALPL